jgi:predicted transcriptional regulator of viral defense system
LKVKLEVVNFEEEMKRVEREVQRLANAEISEKIDYATDTLRIVTPVDTGEARSGWKNKKKINPASNEEGVISNNVEHIVYLNNGHSKQAPRYFIEQVLTKIGILTP